MDRETLSISVVIATRNRGADVVKPVRCLLSDRRANCEIVVVDQSDDDQTQAALETWRHAPGLRYCRMPPLGLSAARNFGVEQSSGTIIAMTDDDCLPSENWLQVIHGEAFQDDYGWLRDRDNPEVHSLLRAENAYTDAVMRHTEAFQETLYTEILGRIKEDDRSVPYRFGRHLYYSRTETGKQYPILCRQGGNPEAPEEVTLDLNRLAEGHPFLSLGAHWAESSDDPWTLLAEPKALTVQFEHTIVATRNGPLILTLAE